MGSNYNNYRQNVVKNANGSVDSNSCINLSGIDSSPQEQMLEPIELLVSNIDQYMDANQAKICLMDIFSPIVRVLRVNAFFHSDGYLVGSVVVASQADAQYAISVLHRKKIASKRIEISFVHQDKQPANLKRCKIIALLKEVPGSKLPLFQFCNIYERRYQDNISVSEIYSLKHLMSVNDDNTGRILSLNLESKALQNFLNSSEWVDPDALRYCQTHCIGPDKSIGWAERDNSCILPYVMMPLSEVSGGLKVLFNSHFNRGIPVASFIECYSAEVGPLPVSPDGAPLEHLISCLPNVSIITEIGGFRYVKMTNFENSVAENFSLNSPLKNQVYLFSRELVDLLKTFPKSELPLFKFIPAYHNHFGRQCRVADYGYTKLYDLLSSLTNIVNIMGEGSKVSITLTHKVQMKRFTSDLYRILKAQPSKQCTVEDLPAFFLAVMERKFLITEYGIWDMEDLLNEIKDTIVVNKTDNGTVILSIPKREQTAEEMEKTRLFATEVFELLRHSPDCKMLLSKFIPSYHHHFGRQCRIADFGFSKLIEIFDVIPEVVQIYEENGEKVLQLVNEKRMKIMADQICSLISHAPNKSINVSVLFTVFSHCHGYSIKFESFGCQNAEDFLEKLHSHVKIEIIGGTPVVKLVDRSSLSKLWILSRTILWNEPKCSLPVRDFVQKFKSKFDESPNVEDICQELTEFLKIENRDGIEMLSVVPVQNFLRDVVVLLKEAGGRISETNFETAFFDRFGMTCRPANYGFPNLTSLFQTVSDVITLKGTKSNRFIVLEKSASDVVHYSPPQLSCSPIKTLRERPPKRVENLNVASTHQSRTSPVRPLSFPPSINAYVQQPPLSAPQNMYPPITPPCSNRPFTSMPGSQLFMNFPSPQQNYQPPHSPVVFQSPPNGYVWSQVWSPVQLPPLTPYMVSPIPLNWGNVPQTPPPLQGTTPKMGETVPSKSQILSMSMLEKQIDVKNAPVSLDSSTFTNQHGYNEPTTEVNQMIHPDQKNQAFDQKIQAFDQKNQAFDQKVQAFDQNNF